jgi:hypothetical protein
VDDLAQDQQIQGVLQYQHEPAEHEDAKTVDRDGFLLEGEDFVLTGQALLLQLEEEAEVEVQLNHKKGVNYETQAY